MMLRGETIFAPSTAAGRAGVAVLRISGPGAGPALETITEQALPPPRRATLATLRDPRSRHAIDRALVLWFPAPQSFTGEDMVELHLHGGRAVIVAASETLAAIDGLRPALPGEFTRRAFDNGKLDLTEVEGLADLIDAETEAQRRQALRQMAGDFSRRIEDWRDRLIDTLALFEAEIDFPDEGLPAGLAQNARAEVSAIANEIKGMLARARQGERLRDGLQVAIVGPPNAGKSSLLNALAMRDVAIVSASAGTTRDVIELHMDLEGYPVTLADTAGLRSLDGGAATGGGAAAEIEAEGMRRARARAAESDCKLAVLDVESWSDPDPELLAQLDEDSFLVVNKIDLPQGPEVTAALAGESEVVSPAVRAAIGKGRALAVSALTGQGVDVLLRSLGRLAAVQMDRGAELAGVTRARHRHSLEACSDALEQSMAAPGIELAAEDLRLATRALGRITGQVDVEDVLESIFANFCIGK